MNSAEYWIERTVKMLEREATELRQHIEALIRMYPDLEGDEFLRASMLEGETNMDEVLTAIHRTIADAMSLRDGTQPRIDELMARRQRFAQRIDFCRDLITSILASAGLKRVELPEVTLSLRNNPPSLILAEDVSAETLPDEVVKITRSPDRKKIKEWLERGLEVPGCALTNGPPSLMVKVK